MDGHLATRLKAKHFGIYTMINYRLWFVEFH